MTRPAPASLVVLGAGALAATGFAPLDWWPVTLAMIAVMLGLVHSAVTQRQAMWRGWLFGVGHFTIGNNWIQHAFDFQDKMPPVLGYGAVFVLALYLALYPMLAAALAWRYGSAKGDPVFAPDARFVLVAGAAWIVTEWLRATMFTGYAWNPLGMIWLPVDGVAGLARVVGTHALSGIAVIAGGALLLLVQRRWHLPAITAAALGAAALSALTLHPLPTTGQPLVRVVQPNIGQDVVGTPGYELHQIAVQLALSGKPGATPRLIVWPEGTVNYYVEDGYPRGAYYGADPRDVRAALASVLGPRDRMLFGGTALMFDREGYINGAGNSVFVLTPDTRLVGRYDKAHLVPYGEYLPLRTLLEPLGLSRLVAGDIDFNPGPGPQSFDVPGFGMVGMQICYEIIFSGQVVDRAYRPAILFNPSNDAWFGRFGPPQHLAQARMRAIEEGLPILRATPTGISAVIDADGRIVAQIPSGVAGAIEVPMPRARPATLFARTGNWMAFAIAGLFLLASVAIRRRRG